MRFATIVAALGLLIAPLTGCRYIVQQAISEAKGAQAVVYPVSQLSADTMQRINSVQFDPCTSETGGSITPSALLSGFDRAATEAQTKELGKALPGGSPALTVRTAMYYFQSKGAFSGAEAIGRSRMYDGGSLVGDVVIRGESESFLAGGERPMASAMVQALVDYLSEKRGKSSK